MAAMGPLPPLVEDTVDAPKGSPAALLAALEGSATPPEVFSPDQLVQMAQNGDELSIQFSLDPPAKRGDLDIKMRRLSLSVKNRGDVVIAGDLHAAIVPDESTWTLANGGTELQIIFTVLDPSKRWPQLLSV